MKNHDASPQLLSVSHHHHQRQYANAASPFICGKMCLNFLWKSSWYSLASGWRLSVYVLLFGSYQVVLSSLVVGLRLWEVGFNWMLLLHCSTCCHGFTYYPPHTHTHTNTHTHTHIYTPTHTQFFYGHFFYEHYKLPWLSLFEDCHDITILVDWV